MTAGKFHFHKGDRVFLTYQDAATVEGEVVIASANSKSLMVMFEGLIDGHLGTMPLLMGEDGEYRSLFTDKVVVVTPVSAFH